MSVLASIIEAESSGSDISATLNQVQGSVYIGLDTRAHSPKLAALAVQGAQLMGAKVIEVGAVTTPQVLFLFHTFVMLFEYMMSECSM